MDEKTPLSFTDKMNAILDNRMDLFFPKGNYSLNDQQGLLALWSCLKPAGTRASLDELSSHIYLNLGYPQSFAASQYESVAYK